LKERNRISRNSAAAAAAINLERVQPTLSIARGRSIRQLQEAQESVSWKIPQLPPTINWKRLQRSRRQMEGERDRIFCQSEKAATVINWKTQTVYRKRRSFPIGSNSNAYFNWHHFARKLIGWSGFSWVSYHPSLFRRSLV